MPRDPVIFEDPPRLDGRTALVTGAAGSIVSAITADLAAALHGGQRHRVHRPAVVQETALQLGGQMLGISGTSSVAKQEKFVIAGKAAGQSLSQGKQCICILCDEMLFDPNTFRKGLKNKILHCASP